MRDYEFKILENLKIADGVYKMRLESDIEEEIKPGQFIEIELPGFYLRRPISISDWDEKTLTIVYKILGKGTYDMSSFKAGDKLKALAALGNGYDISKMPKKVSLAGGGVGVPPLLGLAKKLLESGREVSIYLGFNKKMDLFYEKEFKELGIPVSVATMDGSYGVKGLITDLPGIGDYICACGPMPMLRALSDKSKEGAFSLEARMGCGFGACMGCSIMTKNGSKRVCKDGPVFDKEDIIWQI